MLHCDALADIAHIQPSKADDSVRINARQYKKKITQTSNAMYGTVIIANNDAHAGYTKNMIFAERERHIYVIISVKLCECATWAVFEPGAVRIVHALQSCHYMGNPFLSLMSLVRLL